MRNSLKDKVNIHIIVWVVLVYASGCSSKSDTNSRPPSSCSMVNSLLRADSLVNNAMVSVQPLLDEVTASLDSLQYAHAVRYGLLDLYQLVRLREAEYERAKINHEAKQMIYFVVKCELDMSDTISIFPPDVEREFQETHAIENSAHSLLKKAQNQYERASQTTRLER